jgi:diguanylate cyclase (GGDEF)-like protein
MDGLTFRSRAAAFALCAGAVAFILAVFAGIQFGDDVSQVKGALIIAVVVGILSWGSAETTVSGSAQAVDAAVERLTAAAHGDFASPIPASVSKQSPELAESMAGLFGQVNDNFTRIEHLALFDHVTALPNLVRFRQQGERMIQQLPKGGQALVLLMDLHRFRAISDQHGNMISDQLLCMLGNRLHHLATPVTASETDRRAPVIGRVADHRFAVMMRYDGAQDSPALLAARLFSMLSETFVIEGHQIELGVSIGGALVPDHGHDVLAVLRHADIALGKAKTAGRGEFRLFNLEMAEQERRRQAIDRELRDAIIAKDFRLFFQPQIDVRSGEMQSAECLVRWFHPQRGMIMPGDFIAEAEESGLILEIGDWVVDESIRTLARWHKEGNHCRLAINISPRQIERPDFLSNLEQSLQRHAVIYNRLEIEITESLAMTCDKPVLDKLLALREQGVSVSIDDFGTGYSNLARLKDLPVDRVKLDRCLVNDIVTSTEARVICQAAVSMIRTLGYEVVAEGAETEDQALLLSAMGVDTIQGYVIAQPMAEPELEQFVRNRQQPLAGQLTA